MITDSNYTTRIFQSEARTNSFMPPPQQAPASATDSKEELVRLYEQQIGLESVQWTATYRIRRMLGAGGQGVVCLADRLGCDEITMPVALKIFSPRRYETSADYQQDMKRVASVAARLALIQQDHLLDVQNFVDCGGIRVMVMEWVDGFDLKHLLAPSTLEHTRLRVDHEQWRYLSNVVFSLGPARVRLKPGIANAIVRECLAALAALHREGIVHGDIKPSNIMLKRTGNAKLVDLGAAFDINEGTNTRMVTPKYAAPEVQEGESITPSADLASLGYVLVEMLAGISLFVGLKRDEDLLRAKQRINKHLYEILPRDYVESELLLDLIRGLVAPNPDDRFPSAEAADLFEHGAAQFNRQLVTGNLSSEYESDLRAWIRAVA